MEDDCAPYEDVLAFWKEAAADIKTGPINIVVHNKRGDFVALNADLNPTTGVDMDGSCQECTDRMSRAIVATGYTLITSKGKAN